MKINWKDVAERAAWTFVEAFLVALPSTITVESFDGALLKSALLSAACAGISAVKTMLIDVIKNREEKLNAPD